MSRITTAIHGANILHEKSFVKRLSKFFNTKVLNFLTDSSFSAKATPKTDHFRLLFSNFMFIFVRFI